MQSKEDWCLQDLHVFNSRIAHKLKCSQTHAVILLNLPKSFLMEFCTENGLNILQREYVCSGKDVLNLNTSIYQQVCSSLQFQYKRFGILCISFNIPREKNSFSILQERVSITVSASTTHVKKTKRPITCTNPGTASVLGIKTNQQQQPAKKKRSNALTSLTRLAPLSSRVLPSSYSITAL